MAADRGSQDKSRPLKGTLAGLGQQQPTDTPNSDYRDDMEGLLLWGMRNFPVKPANDGMDLWEVMSLWDSPRAYIIKGMPDS